MCEKYRLLLFNGNEWEKIDSYETSKEGKEAAKSGTVGNAYILCDRNNGNIHMRPLNKDFLYNENISVNKNTKGKSNETY